HKSLLDQLGVATLSGFGADGLGAAFGAAGALLRYAQSTQGRGLQHVKSLSVESESEFIGLDAATRRNLELTEPIRGHESPTLFEQVARCFIPGDSCLLRDIHEAIAIPEACLELLVRAVAQEPAAMVRDGGVFARGFDAELDELHALSENAGQFLVDLETRE